ncbi:MAG: hypothetical protein Q9212_006575 [Teloschistes hypoglaucus]
MHLSSLLAQAAFLGLVVFSKRSLASLVYTRPATPNAQLELQLASTINDTNFIIPGGSPFFYMEDPTGDPFTIGSISMTPNPCQIGINCSIEVRGGFATDLPSLDLDLEIDINPPGGQSIEKIVVSKDNACDWLKVKQIYREACPPKKGFASLNMEMVLARGWVKEGIYSLDLKLISGDKQLTHIGARIKLVDYGPNLNATTANVETA